jgi:CheY-like chemotaxis protein
MESIVKIIESISTLLWPLIVIILILLFRPAIKAIIESAKSRKFTLKIGGQELTMEEANTIQRSLLDDIQTQISELKNKIERPDTHQSADNRKTIMKKSSYSSILWVDDNPKNNSYFIEQLSERKISVDIALSTDEGLSKYEADKYLCIISDMSRNENGKSVPEAGVILLKEVRKIDAKIPFYIFCSSVGIRRAADKAKAFGVTRITSSWSDIFYLLKMYQQPK